MQAYTNTAPNDSQTYKRTLQYPPRQVLNHKCSTATCVSTNIFQMIFSSYTCVMLWYNSHIDANLKHLRDCCKFHPEKTPCSSGCRPNSDHRCDHQNEPTQYATMITSISRLWATVWPSQNDKHTMMCKIYSKTHFIDNNMPNKLFQVATWLWNNIKRNPCYAN